MNVLICGERSFVAKGLVEKLIGNGFSVDAFSRGPEARNGNSVTGDVFAIDENPHLADSYDVVVNFILIKNGDMDENLRYAQALHRFCDSRHVGRLVQISSISVYPNGAPYVDEASAIENDTTRKGSYAAIKIAVDRYLSDASKSYGITFVRPGFIVDDGIIPSMVGIVRSILPGMGILMGNRRTSLPLVRRSCVHEALLRMLKDGKWRDVYLLLENRGGTKWDFAKSYFRGIILPLPRGGVLLAAQFLRVIGVFRKRHLEMLKGLFKTTYFDSSETEYALQMSFSRNSAAVIGSGAMGSYLINRLMEMHPRPAVTLYEAGNARLQDEAGAGYGSKIVGGNYTGLQKGRYFGFGGASVKWGGQLLMFTKNDFAHPSPFMSDIVDLNEKHRAKVFRKFLFDQEFVENHKKYKLFTKTGIWLGYFRRDLFKFFKVSNSPIFIRPDCRVARFIYDETKNDIQGLEYVMRDGKIKHAYFDQYFLCAGAFESSRIALSSGMNAKPRIPFTDHLSQRMFEIKGSQILDGEDFQYGVQGTSLVTKRLIGEVDDSSFFVNPVYNDHFPFFQNLKYILVHGRFTPRILWSILRDIPSAIGFAWSMQIRHKIYVYKNEWAFTIDFENKSDASFVSLSSEKDAWGIPKLVVDFRIAPEADKVLKSAKETMKLYLTECHADYTDCNDVIHVEKSEDTYHPYGMFLSDCSSATDYFTRYQNLFIVNTGVLPRAGGINSTAACFPLIEEYVGEYYGKRIR